MSVETLVRSEWTDVPMMAIQHLNLSKAVPWRLFLHAILEGGFFYTMRASMLIVTLGAASSVPNRTLALSWTGPCVAVLLPGSGLSRRCVDALVDSCHVIEFLEPPNGAMAVLAEVFVRLGHVFMRADWPLVFINREAATAEIETIATTAASNPYSLCVAHDPDGALAKVVIGEMVVSNPLLAQFFGLLSNRNVDDRVGAELLCETFGNLDA